MGKISKALEKSTNEFSKSGMLREKSGIQQETPSVAEDSEGKSVQADNGNKDYFKKKEILNKISDDVDKSLVSVLNPDSKEAEQFRLLKNNILFPETGLPPKSIMVTSSSPNEGKSFVASNLAASIAQSIDEYVVLMDCDLRKPTIHKIFGLSGKDGLSQYLLNQKPLSTMLLKTFINKLTILPAGPIPRNPSELLSSGHMRNLIHEMTLRYNDRYIIIDTPPPYITSEASVISRHVDGIIIVIRHGKTRKKDVADIIDIYGKEKIIGVVQNFAEKRPGYGYGYYKYGYGYGK